MIRLVIILLLTGVVIAQNITIGRLEESFARLSESWVKGWHCIAYKI